MCELYIYFKNSYISENADYNFARKCNVVCVALCTEIIPNNMQENRIFLFHADSSRLYLILGRNENKIFYKSVLR